MQPLSPWGGSFARTSLWWNPTARTISWGLPIDFQQWPDLGISRHFGQIPQPRCIQPLQEGRGVAIPLVAGDPTCSEPPRVHELLNQLGSQFMLGLKGDLVRNPAVLPQPLVILIKPGLGEIETSVK